MNQLETKHGAIRLRRGNDSVYIQTKRDGELRLSADEARIIGKAILTLAEEAEEAAAMERLRADAKARNRKGKVPLDQLLAEDPLALRPTSAQMDPKPN